jgi:hypothetical protein
MVRAVGTRRPPELAGGATSDRYGGGLLTNPMHFAANATTYYIL